MICHIFTVSLVFIISLSLVNCKEETNLEKSTIEDELITITQISSFTCEGSKILKAVTGVNSYTTELSCKGTFSGPMSAYFNLTLCRKTKIVPLYLHDLMTESEMKKGREKSLQKGIILGTPCEGSLIEIYFSSVPDDKNACKTVFNRMSSQHSEVAILRVHDGICAAICTGSVITTYDPPVKWDIHDILPDKQRPEDEIVIVNDKPHYPHSPPYSSLPHYSLGK